MGEYFFIFLELRPTALRIGQEDRSLQSTIPSLSFGEGVDY